MNDRDCTREYFDKLVLIEAIVDGTDEPFDMSRFGQMQTQVPDDPKPMQVGYDEGLLSEDGDTLTDRKRNCVQGTGPLRFAVYLHQFDPQRPLRWKRGEVICPPIREIPLRLLLLMPYNVCC